MVFVVDSAFFVTAAVSAVTLLEYNFDYHDDDMGFWGSFGNNVVNVLVRGGDDSGIDPSTKGFSTKCFFTKGSDSLD